MDAQNRRGVAFQFTVGPGDETQFERRLGDCERIVDLKA